MTRIRHRLAVVCLVGAGVAVGGTAHAGETKEDKKLARAALIRAEDLPSGWREQKAEEDDEAADRIAKSIDACDDVARARRTLDKAPSAESRDFVKDDVTISSAAGTLKSGERASSVFAAYADDQALDCLGELYERLIARNAAEEDVRADVTAHVGHLTGPTFGDESVRLQAEVTIEAEGISQDAAVDVVFIRVDRVIASYQVITEFGPPLEDPIPSLVDVTTRRVRSALSGEPPSDPNAGAALGETLLGPNGVTVTVFTFQPNAPSRYSPEEFSSGPPGSSWGRADIQVCAPPVGEADVNPFAFVLTLADNTRAEGESTLEEPALNYATVHDGECARGLVDFVMPAGSVPAQILYEETASEIKPLRWALA